MPVVTDAQSDDGRLAAADDARRTSAWMIVAVAIALASGTAFFTRGLPALAGHERSGTDAAGTDAAGSTVAEVTSDIPGALSTIDISPSVRPAVEGRLRRCALHLAWVSVAGRAGGTIRLQSGNYFSPLFALGPAPVRVAIPYPGTYAGGHGTIGAFIVGDGAVVGLQPAWRVHSAGESLRNVTWRPRSCASSRG